MPRPAWIRPMIVVAAWAGLMAGCGSDTPTGGAEPMESLALRDLGEAYRIYSINNKRPPKEAADLYVLEAAAPTGVLSLRQGDVVARWGVELPDLGEEPGKGSSTEILGYEKQAPERGGFVLLVNRTVKKMSADEFKAAPKAGTE